MRPRSPLRDASTAQSAGHLGGTGGIQSLESLLGPAPGPSPSTSRHAGALFLLSTLKTRPVLPTRALISTPTPYPPRLQLHRLLHVHLLLRPARLRQRRRCSRHHLHSGSPTHRNRLRNAEEVRGRTPAALDHALPSPVRPGYQRPAACQAGRASGPP